MPQTNIRGSQILNSTVQRQDLDVSTVGQAVVTKIVQGSGISLSSTGADSGTGDVTVSAAPAVSTDAGNIATLGSDNLILVPQSQIWSVRLRSFNALGNPTFEVDQRNVGAALTNPATGTWLLDRYQLQKSALTGTVNVALQTGLVTIPGTNFAITNNFLRFTVGTTQASLAAGDYYSFQQTVEGPRWRELSSDVHSVSILIRSSVAGLAFSLNLRNPGGTSSLSKLCTIPSANTWTLISSPNIPIWSGSGFVATPGSPAYLLAICLASGTTFTPPANNTWQSGNFLGAIGMSNFLATAGATYDIGYLGHEPGALCTTPQDCPFTQNLDDSLRYFQKSYPYSQAISFAGAGSYAVFNSAVATAGAFGAYGTLRFPKAMAKTPTGTAYHHSTGAANSALGFYATSGTIPNASGNFSISAVVTTASQISSVNSTGTSPSPIILIPEWTADTGW